MASDGLFYLMTQPYGLGFIVLAIVIPFLFWRQVLGIAFPVIGFKPLAAGYVAALFGLLAQSFLFSYIEFSTRVSNGILAEVQRWLIVPNWTIYIGVLSLVFVLPILGVIGVPWSAMLVKRNRLGYRNIFAALLLVWISLALLVWLLPSNEWHRTHRLQSLFLGLKDLAPSFLLVGLPFLSAIFFVARSGRCAES